MPMSWYYQELRKKIGTQRLLIPSVAAIVRNSAGDILFQRPSGGLDVWSLPAGSIEPAETPAEATIREVYEETGLHVHPDKLVAVLGGEPFRSTYPDGNQAEFLICVFECVTKGGHLEAIDGESADLQYFPVASMPTLALPYPQAVFTPCSSERALFY
jgi:ADP-ribose pyrophosphatase YjhB (NUDIX family)